jgi:hypothetical protein
LITGCNVLAHNRNPARFLARCHDVLRPDGIVVLEFPYAAELLARYEFDTIYHEHLSYFLASSFTALARRSGFCVVDAMLTPIHGGSVRFFLRKPVVAPQEHSAAVRELLDREHDLELHDLAGHLNFARVSALNADAFRALVANHVGAGIKVVAYGASAKGNTALNFARPEGIEYVVDDNPMKHGLLTPGLDLPIRPPVALSGENQPLSIVLTAWNFEREIRERVRKVRGRANDFDQYLLYVPRARSAPAGIELP